MGKRGPKPRTHCPKGHDASIYRVVRPSGKTYCGQCRKEYKAIHAADTPKLRKTHCKHGHDLSQTRSRRQDGHTYCTVCAEEFGKVRQWYYRLRTYGITKGQFTEMLVAQKGGCAICHTIWGSGRKGPFIDHDHITGRVRGLLCHSCNAGIGLLRDDPEIMQSAITYLTLPATSL